ncbi:MAG TPA: hypothetical protein ENJ51_06490 [Leucothrix mucor]|uniref:Lipoprotein n=1 Tax=Leucothrix mucor TaxID=45248 RepID=A0A7V2T301_LEUMU|nr:hypothetical protein [Leucothrix mucor]
MKKLLFICFLTLSTSLCATPKPLLLEGTVGSYYFKLSNDKQHCQLAIKDADKVIQSFSLSSQSPCYFFADSKQEKIQTYSYPDAKVDTILLIGGTAIELSAEERQLKKLPTDSYCTQDSQAITLENGKIKIGAVRTKTFACAEDRLDEIVYQQVLQNKRDDIETYTARQIQKNIKMERSNASFFDRLQQKINAIF